LMQNRRKVCDQAKYGVYFTGAGY